MRTAPLLVLLLSSHAFADNLPSVPMDPEEALLAVEVVQTATPPVKTTPTWHLEAVAGTRFPVAISGSVAVISPIGLGIELGLGGTPNAYIDAVNAANNELDLYSEAVAMVLDETLGGSLSFTAEMRYRPFPKYGFTIRTGYQLMHLTNAFDNSESLGALDLPEAITQAQLEVVSDVHMWTAHLGYQWEVANRFVIRVEAGGAFSFAANSKATLNGPSAVADLVEEPLAEELDKTYPKYLHTPSVGLHIGYRFF